jgi:tyrosyl-tRNA synthetase
MFGKVMSIRDELIPKYFLLCTGISLSEIDRMKDEMASGKLNPRDAKILLGEEIVKRYYGEKEGKKAGDNFLATFSEKKIPSDVNEYQAVTGSLLSDSLISAGVVSSKTEWRRLVSEGAVSLISSDNHSTKISDFNFKIEAPGIFKVGKHRFLKIVLK